MNPKILIGIIVTIGILIFTGSQMIGVANILASLTASLTGDCRSVYCTDYEFICCGEKLDYSGSWDLGSGYDGYWQCGFETTRCVVTKQTQSIPSYCYAGDAGCDFDWFGNMQCSNDRDVMGLSTVTLRPGEYIHGACGQLSYQAYKLRLAWCGDAACDAGVTGLQVQGSSGCSYVTNEDVYDKSGRLIRSVAEGEDFTATVPQGNCYLSPKSARTVCGDTCESCSSDADCAIGHTYSYNGKGAECSTGKLELYGCKQYGSEPSEDDKVRLPWESKFDYNFGSRCDIVQTIYEGIECCPGSDSCWLGATCNPATFRCEDSGQVECTQDWECGTATGCTYEGGKPVIKSKRCVSNKCSSSIDRYVNCCYDTDCSSTDYCDSDYNCKQRVQEPLACPFECCVGEVEYRDRPCPDGEVCCGDHTCRVSCDQVPDQQKCNYNNRCEGHIGETKQNCPDCKWDLWEIMKIFLAALLVSGIIIGVLFVVSMMFPPLFFITKPLRKPRIMIAAWLLLALALTLLFSIPMASIYASVVRRV